MESLVLSVLSRPEVSKIGFTLGGMRLGASSFRLVGEKIRQGKVDVVFSPDLGPNAAKYRHKENRLFLGFRAGGLNADSESLIVHECVHMACDLSAISLQVALDEAAAYTAQCLYFYYRNEQALKQPGVRPTFSDPILREAWDVATVARGRKVLNDSDNQKLLLAISRHRLYRRTHTLTKHYDG